jgi:hypothetical protein
VLLPPGIDPRCYGAVPTPLVESGIIRAAGYRATERPEANARPVTLWALTDRTAALSWLDAHPPLPDFETAAPIQRGLWV